MSDQTPNDQHQPDLDDTFTYDVYLSYSDADQRWVHDTLLPRLEAEGVRVCLGERDFRLGVPRIAEQERAVLTSRKTLVILSPSFLASAWTAFDRLLQQTLDAESREYRLIPLRKEPCELPPSLRYLTAANFIDPSNPASEWTRLIATLRTALPVPPPLAIPVLSIPAPVPLPPGSRMPLSHNPLFVGREEELRELAQVLKAGETVAIGQVAIAATTGLGGIGKTQLAAEFVHRYGQFFAGGVFWLSFADPAVVPAEIAACGGLEGMRLSADFDALPFHDQVRRVVAEWRSPLSRLLVFDNCEDEALLDEWRPKHGGCRVLMTSRRAKWDAGLGVHAMPLSVLPRIKSIALLRAFCPDLADDDADLDAIADELGDLPLALHLAGSFLKRYQRSMTAGVYLDTLRAAVGIAHESLEGAGISPTKHDLSVARTFRLSYDRLDVMVPVDAVALRLLACAVYFARGEPISQAVLCATLNTTDSAPCRFWAQIRTFFQRRSSPTMVPTQQTTWDALHRLIDLGLLEADTQESYRVHRLVAAFVRALTSDDLAQIAVERTMLGIARTLNARGYPAPLLALQPHLRAITNAALEQRDANAAALANEFAYHLQLIGAYAEAQGYYEQALTIRQRVLGPEHPTTAQSLNNLGGVLRVQGQYAEAQGYYEQALAIYQRVLGPEHPDTA
ncbi:MAG TPA: toll/interleukin-1 receptor domain-containing protein, partial [Herpetosiphonaceae bacterium]